jgi:hypothetical protein
MIVDDEIGGEAVAEKGVVVFEDYFDTVFGVMFQQVRGECDPMAFVGHLFWFELGAIYL